VYSADIAMSTDIPIVVRLGGKSSERSPAAIGSPD